MVYKELTVTVVVRVGDDIRPIVLWSGTRTHLEDRLVGGFERYAREQHWLDEARTRWKVAVHVPVGHVVTTTRARFPIDGEIYLATPDGLAPLSYADAMDALDPDPARIDDRAAQRAHDAAADAAGLPATLTRFVGAHTLKPGVHATGNSHYFAERCTARQAYWRRATREEVTALLRWCAPARFVACRKGGSNPDEGPATVTGPPAHRGSHMSFFARLMALLTGALGAARNGLSAAYGWLHDAAAEAVQPFLSRAPAFRDAALAGAGYGAIAAGTALRAPGALLSGVGSVLRRVLPISGQTAGAVAAEAVARDNGRGGGEGPNPGVPVVDMAAQMLHSAAEDLRQGGPAALAKYQPYVPKHVADWLAGLDRRDLDVAIRLDPGTLHRHANAERQSETTPLLPLPAHMRPDYVKSLYMSPEELAAMKAQALRNLANSSREAAAMATRGPRPRPAPDQGWDGNDYDAPRPSMH